VAGEVSSWQIGMIGARLARRAAGGLWERNLRKGELFMGRRTFFSQFGNGLVRRRWIHQVGGGRVDEQGPGHEKLDGAVLAETLLEEEEVFGDDHDDEEVGEEEEMSEYDQELIATFIVARDIVQTRTSQSVKKLKSLQKQLAVLETVPELRKRAMMIFSNLHVIKPFKRHMKDIITVEVDDYLEDGSVSKFKIELHPSKYKSPNEEAEALYTLAVRHEKAQPRVSKLVSECEEQYKSNLKLQNAFLDVEKDGSLEKLGILLDTPLVTELLNNDKQQKAIQKEQRRRREQKKHGVRQEVKRLIAKDGFHILVGRSAKENDKITFQMTSSNDIWMHARDCPGSHVVVKIESSASELSQTTLQLAANLAAANCKKKNDRRVSIIVANGKHLRRPRGGKLGSVIVQKELNEIVGFPSDAPPTHPELE